MADDEDPVSKATSEAVRRAGVTIGPDGKVGVKDAIRLKLELNKMCTYGGRTAPEVKSLQDPGSDTLRRLAADYRQPLWVQLLPTLVVGIVVSPVALIWPNQHWLLWFIGIPLLVAAGKIEGRSQGFLEGCQAGFAEGVNKVLGISPEENAELHQTAIEIQTDQMIVDEFDRGDAPAVWAKTDT